MQEFVNYETLEVAQQTLEIVNQTEPVWRSAASESVEIHFNPPNIESPIIYQGGGGNSTAVASGSIR